MDQAVAFRDDTMYRILVQGVVDYAIYMIGPDGTVMNWNAGAERAKGYQASEIVGQNFSRFYTEEDRRAGIPQKALATARASGKFESRGWRVRRDGRRFWAHVVIDAIFDPDGELIGFAKITRDLTAQKRQSEELQRVTETLDLALSHMSQGLILFDAEERMVLCNARWRELVGGDDALISPGITVTALMHRLLTLNEPEIPAEDLGSRVAYEREKLLATLLRAAGMASEEMRFNGRILVMSHRPLPEGGWVTTVDDVTERRSIEERIVHLAHHDVLTDLPNRTVVYRSIQEVSAGITSPRACALLYIDLDRFKPINDTFGHGAGDIVLRAIADRIRGQLRPRDVAARLGGDEFVVVARDCVEAPGALALADRIIQVVGQPIQLDGALVTVGASIGVAVMPEDGCDADTLLNHADVALYKAKEGGRNRASLYDPAVEAALRERRLLEQELRHALRTDGFELHYQPVVNVNSDRPTGLETLLRWSSPSRGPVPPASFIPFAEEIGLMPDIDDWVLRKACAEAMGWSADLTVSVNLSPTQFLRPGLVDRVKAVLASTGLPASRLELEITETATIDNLAAATEILEGIRALGVQIALDDFGTGYSSLSLIRNLPFSRIKIDRSFVQDMGSNPHAAAIVHAVCSLCQGLGVRATAEGVETAAQMERLHAEGCTDLQGYLISRPLPSDAVLDWLSAFNSSRTDHPGGLRYGRVER